MSVPTRVTSYPTWMLRMADEFETGTRVKVLNLPDRKTAEKYRRNIYGFRNALERAGMFPMYPNFQTIRLAIRGNDLHIMLADELLPNPGESIATH